MLYPHLAHRQIVLASQSPRRLELVKKMGLDPVCRVLDVDESYPAALEGTPAVAEYVARKKAEAHLPALTPDEVLITGDTVVVANGRILEKPRDLGEAASMLRTLSGQTHTVASGLALTTAQSGITSVLDVCHVRLAPFSDAFVDHYLSTGQSLDKAGSYGIQDLFGLSVVEHLDGSYYTVMGLPTHRLHQLLTRL